MGNGLRQMVLLGELTTPDEELARCLDETSVEEDTEDVRALKRTALSQAGKKAASINTPPHNTHRCTDTGNNC